MNIIHRTLLHSASLGAVVLGAPFIARAQESRILRLGITTPPGHPWNNAAMKVGEMLTAETNGRRDIAVFPANQLGTEAAMLQQR